MNGGQSINQTGSGWQERAASQLFFYLQLLTTLWFEDILSERCYSWQDIKWTDRWGGVNRLYECWMVPNLRHSFLVNVVGKKNQQKRSNQVNKEEVLLYGLNPAQSQVCRNLSAGFIRSSCSSGRWCSSYMPCLRPSCVHTHSAPTLVRVCSLCSCGHTSRLLSLNEERSTTLYVQRRQVAPATPKTPWNFLDLLRTFSPSYIRCISGLSERQEIIN